MDWNKIENWLPSVKDVKTKEILVIDKNGDTSILWRAPDANYWLEDDAVRACDLDYEFWKPLHMPMEK